MKIKFLLIFCLSFLLTLSAFSQDTLFYENFETGVIPFQWSQEFVKGSVNWRYEDGGYTTDPGVPNSRIPPHAHGGSYNALFQLQGFGLEETKLVTKEIKTLEFAIKPELHFWNAQGAWDGANDELKVYYKNGKDSAWVLLKEYLNPAESWTERIIALPDSTLSSSYYLAFSGKTNWGWGTCIDDITIIETGIINKRLDTVKITQASTASVPSGSKNNPILRLEFKVFGNSGTCPLDSLVVNSLNTDDQDISAKGVKLYFTESTEFNEKTPVGDSVDFVGGKAVFKNIGFDLPLGYSYLWVTYDVDSMANHRDILDGSIDANSILINDTLYPSLPVSPVGTRSIYQTVYLEDFENGDGWSLSGEFQRGRPQGLGGTIGNPDPDYAYSDTTVIGTDLYGLGTYPGDYEINLPANAYQAISPEFDFKYYNDLSIRYFRWLNIDGVDKANIDISTDGGTTWQNAWTPQGLVLDNKWTLHELDITDLVQRKSHVKIRFTLGSTNGFWQFSGWNIDNFAITGNYITKDVGISKILTPVNGCGHSANDSITTIVKNYGAEDSPNVIPLYYKIGSQIIRDTIRQSILFGDSLQFTFSTKYDLSNPDIYQMEVGTSLTGDEDSLNNKKTMEFIVQPTIQPPFIETFEQKRGLWLTSTQNNSSWEWGIFDQSVGLPSGTKAWATRISGSYNNNEYSYIESPCYDLTNVNRNIISFSYWLESVENEDGVAVYYTTDNGNNWQLVDSNEFGWDWGWYTDSVKALDDIGWSGMILAWNTGSQLLSADLKNYANVKFRIVFASDSTVVRNGVIIDNFAIYPAPPDLGVVSIDAPKTDCQYANTGLVTVSVKNFGLNVVKAQDSVVIGMEFNGEAPYLDTLAFTSDLAPGDSTQFTFDKLVNIDTPDTYNITAYTIGEEMPSIYSTNNDTAKATFVILPNPYTNLLDTIQTKEPDTVKLVPYYDPGYAYLWQPGDSTNSVYHTAKDGWYYLTVTDVGGNGCSSIDSSYVELLFNDVGIDSLISPVTSCMLGNEEYLTVQIKNYGTDSIAAGENIVVAYEFEGGPPVLDTLTLGNTFYSKHVLPYTFNKGPLDLTSPGIYHFKLYSDFGGDTIPENDTTWSTVQVYGYPVVSVGKDTIVKALSYTLDAGSGFESYLWNNGDTTQTHIATTPGYHKVIVVDNNNCSASDSAYVWLKIRDISPTLLMHPVSTCDLNSAVQAELRITNTGNDTIPAATNINVKYKLNENTPVSENFSPGLDILPGGIYNYTFSHMEDMTTPDNYDFTFTATTSGDLRSSNDTLDSTVYVYPRPVVSFPPDDIVKVYALSDTLDAGYGDNYAYKWQDGSTNQKYVATVSNFYHVTVTDSYTGCSDRDTVFVQLIITDIGVTGIHIDTVLCPGTYDNVDVDISNLGNGSMGVGTKFYLSYQDNKKDTVTLQSVLVAGAKLTHTLTKSLDFSETGNQQLAVSTILNADLRPENDLESVDIRIVPNPIVDFGTTEDTIRATLPYTLSAGTGFSSYLWGDGSTNSTYAVTTPGYYEVTVTGEAGCEGTAGIYVDQETYVRNLSSDIIDVSVYPVPASSQLNIEVNSEPGNVPFTMEILSNSGQVLYTDKIQQGQPYFKNLDISNYKSGIYFIRIYNDNYLHISKVIKQ